MIGEKVLKPQEINSLLFVRNPISKSAQNENHQVSCLKRKVKKATNFDIHISLHTGQAKFFSPLNFEQNEDVQIFHKESSSNS